MVIPLSASRLRFPESPLSLDLAPLARLRRFSGSLCVSPAVPPPVATESQSPSGKAKDRRAASKAKDRRAEPTPTSQFCHPPLWSAIPAVDVVASLQIDCPASCHPPVWLGCSLVVKTVCSQSVRLSLLLARPGYCLTLGFRAARSHRLPLAGRLALGIWVPASAAPDPRTGLKTRP